VRHSNCNAPLVTSGVNGAVEMTLFVFVRESPSAVQEFTRVEWVKVLGVIIEHRLLFDMHINNLLV